MAASEFTALQCITGTQWRETSRKRIRQSPAQTQRRSFGSKDPNSKRRQQSQAINGTGGKAARIQSAPQLKASRNRRFDLRGLNLTEVPVETLASGNQKGMIAERWPRRIRMRPLDTWRGERVVYERLPGSLVPSIARVMLNCAPRPGNLPGSPSPIKMLPLPAPLGEAPSEAIGSSTSNSVSKLITLPAWDPNKAKYPFTHILDKTGLDEACQSTAILKVLEGQIQCTLERPGGKREEIFLGKGSTAVVPAMKGVKVLVAAAGDSVVRLWWVVVSEGPRRPLRLYNESD